MDRYLKWFERTVVFALIVMMSLVILLSTVELGWIIILDVITPPIILPQISELLEIFGFFLLILIGIELLETLRAYLVEQVVHVEVVLEVALIAIARKVIILEPKEMPGVTVFAIAALILALATGFLLVRRSRRRSGAVPVSKEY
ncbi:MAG: phosphate-starvation-inducible PsiE family protein [Anaerolineae bacterium]|jgi:uncharacterized membrane protein (DUF373 family)